MCVCMYVCVCVCDRDKDMKEEKGGKKDGREREQKFRDRKQVSDSFFHQRI